MDSHKSKHSKPILTLIH